MHAETVIDSRDSFRMLLSRSHSYEHGKPDIDALHHGVRCAKPDGKHQRTTVDLEYSSCNNLNTTLFWKVWSYKLIR